MVATGLLAAAYLLQADFDRRRGAIREERLPEEQRQASHHDEGFRYWRRRTRRSGGGKIFTPSKTAHVASRTVQSLTICLVGGFLGGLSPAVSGEAFQDSTLNSWTCARRGGGWLRIGRIGCLLSGDGATAGHIVAWPWGMAFPHGVVPHRNCVQWGWPATAAFTPLPFMNFSFG